jgi:TRAP transporter 4TM/12TM fusion protein
VAGGIEPAASISGMFMPPIMGAGGFIMAELTGLPYSRIMLIAIFPAMMYVFSVFTMVHFEAKIHGIKGEKSEHNAWNIFKEQWLYAAPLVVITYFMLTGYSPAYSAIIGLASCVAISHKTTETKIDLSIVWVMVLVLLFGWGTSLLGMFVEPASIDSIKKIFSENILVVIGLVISAIVAFARHRKGSDIKTELKRFVVASRKGADSSLKIGATVGVIGIIIGVLTYSGLMLTIADIIIDLAAGRLWLTILLIAFASLILGMGVPVTAAYLITAVVAVPALTHLGVNEVAAHMIVYWLSQDSNITPPVCIAAFAGATIAKANMWRTAFSSFKFAKFLYLGPFIFGYVPGFSLNGSYWDIIKAFVLIALGTYAYSYFLSLHWLYFLNGSLEKKRAAQAARVAAQRSAEASA